MAPMETTVDVTQGPVRPNGVGERIVVWAPLGRTAQVVQDALVHAGFSCVICEDVESFCRLVDEGVGAAVLIEEVLAPAGVSERVQAMLEAQPRWSDLPVLVFVHSCKRLLSCFDYLMQTSSRRGITILERSISPEVLLSLLQAALRNRRRQYRLREALQQLRDMNEALEEQVAVRTGEVRGLASELTRSEQRERRRIARVLHDGLQQQLYAAQMQLQVVHLDAPETAPMLERLHQLLDEGIEMTRHLAAELSSPVLHDEGLDAAIAWLAGQMQARFGLDVVVDGDPGCDPQDEDLRELVFQVVRELLFNVVKHAGVQEARVVLSRQDGHCMIEVIDEGRGFDPDVLHDDAADARPGGTGMGLPSLIKRVGLVAGDVDVRAAPEQGTHVTMRMPVHEE